VQSLIAHVKTWWAAHLVWIGGAVGFLDPSVSHYLAAHPGTTFTGILVLVWAAIKNPLNPPSKPAATLAAAAPAVAAPAPVPTVVKKP
jgi:hypothetical protein